MANLPGIGCGIVEEGTDGEQFLVVQFQCIAFPERIPQQGFGIILLPQVHVKDLVVAVPVRHGVEEAVDGGAGNGAALCQRTEADHTRLGG